jgi:hypothetical protein
VEKVEQSSDPPPSSDSNDQFTFTVEGAEAALARHEKEREEATLKRRADRLAGKPPHDFNGRLEKCTVLQLERVKKLCDFHIKRQRDPPDEYAGRHPYTVHVLRSMSVKASRFQLEFRRTSLRGEKVYVNGPYIRRYWWDGSIVKSEHIKKDNNLRRNLPKKVWVDFRDFLERPEYTEMRRTLSEKLQRESPY